MIRKTYFDEPIVPRHYPSKRFSGDQVDDGNGFWIFGPSDDRRKIADPANAQKLYQLFRLSRLTAPDLALEQKVHFELDSFRREKPDWFRFLLAELDMILDCFMGTPPPYVHDDNLLETLRQFTVCKVWLDFLQGDSDYEAGTGVHVGRLFLWKRYYVLSGVLNDADRSALSISSWQMLDKWPHLYLDDEYRRALRNWWRILADPANEWFFIHLCDRKDSDKRVARVWEAEVNALVRTQSGDLRPFFYNAGDVARSFLDRVVRVWYLPRMDLIGCTRIVRDLLPAHGVGRVMRLLYTAGFPWLGVGLIVLLFVAAALVQVPLAPVVMTYAYGEQGTIVLHSLEFMLGWAALGLTLVGGAGYLIVWLCLGRLGIYPFSLRVAAGTVVGLIALPGLSDNVARFLFAPTARPDGSPWTGILLLGVALVASFLYLFSDAMGRLNDMGLALRRAGHLFLFGWAQATIFAALASLLAAEAILLPGEMDATTLHSLDLGVGVLYWGFIIAGGIVSFAIGVFTQILWAGLAVTEPL